VSKTLNRFLPLCLLTVFCGPTARAQSGPVIKALTCQLNDVKAVINGPLHTAANGDTIQLPPGLCTWASGIAVPNKIGITIIGSGTPNSSPSTTGASSSCSATEITYTATPATNAAMISATPAFGAATMRISCIKFVPSGAKGNSSNPIQVIGSCTASGCPNLRIDNITGPSSWAGIGISDDSFAVVSNMFGVADHNTIGDVQSSSNGVDFVNIAHGNWAGVGSWGDNSWASPDTFGTNQAFYLENNTFNYAFGTDADRYGSSYGGGRFVCRFNTFNQVSGVSDCGGHGTDTIGRTRGVRQGEFYHNISNCPPNGCPSLLGLRSGVGISFGNTYTGFLGNYMTLSLQRPWRVNSVFGACDGSSPWDTNDGVTYHSGTIGSVTSANGQYTVVDSSSPGWKAGQWAIVNGAPFSFHDVTGGFGFQLSTNTANSITSYASCLNSGCSNAPAANHSYQVLRAKVCLDQPARSGGLLVEGGDGGQVTDGHVSPILVSTGSPGSVLQNLDPNYEFADVPAAAHGGIAPLAASQIPNRDFYAEISGAAQTSPTSPFNGAAGTGFGTLANRPTTCTNGVAYWATDQGSWNTSGSGGQGQLFVCSAPNTWSLHYTPYTYPHPLVAGGTTGTDGPPDPPTSIKIVVQ